MRAHARKSGNNYIWLFIIVLGTITAVLGAAVNHAVLYLSSLHLYLTLDLTDYLWAQLIVWCSFTGVVASIGILVSRWAPNAQGSGIPEIKSILSGVPLHNYLALKTLFVKIVGLTCALGSGLYLGKEGPFVHVSSIVANHMLKYPLFVNLKENARLYQQMIAVAAACGVASAFGAPIGGVLFSIEVTSTYYPVRDYYYSFDCALISAVLWLLLNLRLNYIPTFFEPQAYSHVELPVFALIGAIMGLVGPMFVYFIRYIVISRRRFAKTVPKKLRFLSSPYVYALVVIGLTTLVTFPGFIGTFMSLTSSRALSDLFSEDPLTDVSDLYADDWVNQGGIYLSFLLFICGRYIITAFNASLPLPSGVYLPVLVIGASMGRFMGEMLQDVLPSIDVLDMADAIVPGGYAVVGAAAFAAAVTHTYSSAVVIFEITGQMSFGVPTVLAVVIAIAIASHISMSIYETILTLRGLPFMPDIPHSGWRLKAKDIMTTNVRCISKDDSPTDIARTLADTPDHKSYPVVDNIEHKLLIGTVTRHDLLKYLIECVDATKIPYPTPDRAKARKYSNSTVASVFKDLKYALHGGENIFIKEKLKKKKKRKKEEAEKKKREEERKEEIRQRRPDTFLAKQRMEYFQPLHVMTDEEYRDELRQSIRYQKAAAKAATDIEDTLEFDYGRANEFVPKHERKEKEAKKRPTRDRRRQRPTTKTTHERKTEKGDEKRSDEEETSVDGENDEYGGGRDVPEVHEGRAATTTSGDDPNEIEMMSMYIDPNQATSSASHPQSRDAAAAAVARAENDRDEEAAYASSSSAMSTTAMAAPDTDHQAQQRRQTYYELPTDGGEAGYQRDDSSSSDGDDDDDEEEGTRRKRHKLRKRHQARRIHHGTPFPVKPTPIQLLRTTPLPYVHMLFITLRLSECYVTSYGRLVGVVNRQHLRALIRKQRYNRFLPSKVKAAVAKKWKKRRKKGETDEREEEDEREERGEQATGPVKKGVEVKREYYEAPKS